ncbi:Manganese-dependent 2,3-dihydroxybiphenyl 1,2-dioxygenase [Baekduia alba]|uniref:3,4-dihydroxyphenylacetate 2,3-dioxygenase n=1 Tax=Baekduia alba TaxID=2997333 RepID=UPI00233FF324|nr:3,4-dihydroxyphenylacetate 2,3-dioxygenase [Baekduia alba]WCB95259.1 Manganese-dependent 2,3-dihydroxybiphenyl 1,2-dioxygenase [Baekduia alba]
MAVTRVGHVELFSADLDRSADFYVDVLGLIETERDDDHVYLRCLEDREHHTLILTRAAGNGLGHIGFRVDDPADLDALAAAYRADGIDVVEVDAEEERAQGPAIRLRDPLGFPVEFYHRVEPVARTLRTHGNRGPSRLDHLNLRLPGPVDAGVAYYRERLGFLISEYALHPDGTTFAAWLHRKQTTHDVALVQGPGTLIHHVGLYVPESHDVLHVADRMAARGMQAQIEFGPGRHGITNAFFSYIRDPDDNRIEIYSGDYLIPDPDFEPVAWTAEEFEATGRLAWGARPPASMYEGQPVADWSRPPARASA